MLSKAASRTRWRELRDLTNEWDPIGLIRLGAPQDEYECVLGALIRLLERQATVQEVTGYLVKEFADHFGSPIEESSAVDFATRASSWYSARWAEL